ncbi:hypothetical protein OVA26_15945 [Microbacterium sp. SL62]|uniref:hypothetical protein n=1 Tax=Microbacterium sp. SL62 TaxID=2995139 RepID=UPI002276083B|nr:hypothetical protein [Microbacterium sp. SL62]MCY1718427.1 hypothetical protein [Microbacterium sp. SL62]
MTTTPSTTAPFRSARFVQGDRVRHPRGWYGAVIEDPGGDAVLVRFDDGTPFAWIPRDTLRLVDELDEEIDDLTERLKNLQLDARLTPEDIATVRRTVEALSLALTERGLRVRVAAEIDRLAERVIREPIDPQITKQPRVRQWFADGARWALQQMRDTAHQRRDATDPLTPPSESKVA